MSFLEEIKQSKSFKLTASYLGICFVALQVLDPLSERKIISESLFRVLVYLLVGGTPVPFFIGFFNDKSSGKFIKKKLNLNVVASFMALFTIFYLSIKNIELKQSSKRLNSLDYSLEQIIDKFDNGDNLFVFNETKKLLDSFPENRLLKLYYEKSSYPINIKTGSLIADVFIKHGSDTVWNSVGQTPIDSMRVPWFFEKHNFQLKFKIKDRIILAIPESSGEFNLDNLDKYPLNHSIIHGTKNNLMFLPGVDFGNISIESFSISKTEISNKEFQVFVNQGGYENESYWDFPITIDGTEYNYKEAIKMFVDKHGQNGPSNWSYGQFEENTENYPVTGISWFEARAFARYKGCKLPNIFEWLCAAGLSGFVHNIPDITNSNLKSSHLWSVNDPRSVNHFGLKNIAGNVREWITNPKGINKTKYSILGGSYNDNKYSFNNYHSVSPFDRSIGNGFRVVYSANSDTSNYYDNYVINYNERNILSEDDVSDEVFDIYRQQFQYEKYDLNPEIDSSQKNENYIIYKFLLKPPYDSKELLHGYVIYSKKSRSKLNPIIQFPTAGAILSDSDDWIVSSVIKDYNYLLMEGYAIICPVYYSTYNRKKVLKTWWANDTDLYKETIIKIGKDYKRCIDFIESREEFNFNNLSYFGYSWGSIMSNILLAIDNRVKSAFICAGGLQVQKSKPEIDPALFTRRIKIPVMHITGKNDGIFDYENSQLPMQKLLGTPLKDQEMIVLDGVGHAIPKDIMIGNHLRWLKKYN